MGRKLKNNVDHKTFPDKYKNYFVQCPLLSTTDSKMSSLGICCSSCCVRISQVISALDDMLVRSVFTTKEYRQRPQIFYDLLPVTLKEYAETVSKVTGKDWVEIKFICGRCLGEPVEKVPSRFEKATEMTCLKRNDFS